LQTPSQAHITERYNLLRENNLVSYRNFKRDTVFEVFGAEIADMIFRRNANDETNTEDTAQDMTQEDTDRIMVDLSDVSPGYGTETLPEQVNTGRIIGDFDNFGDTGGGTP